MNSRLMRSIFLYILLFLIISISTVSAETLHLVNYPSDSMGDLRTEDNNGAHAIPSKWNVSGIPANSSVRDSQLCYFIFEIYEVVNFFDDDVTVYRIDNQTWETSTITASDLNTLTLDTPKTTTFNESFADDTWVCVNVTEQVQKAVDNGNVNLSLRIEDPDYAIDTFISVSDTGENKFGDYNGGDGPMCKMDTADGGGGSPFGNQPELTITYGNYTPPVSPSTPTITFDGVTQYSLSDGITFYEGLELTLQANITDPDSDFEVILYINGTAYNKTDTNTSVGVYEHTIGLNTNVHNITWYVTDYVDEVTDEDTFTVTQASSTVTLLVNGTTDTAGSSASMSTSISLPETVYLSQSFVTDDDGTYSYLIGGIDGGTNLNTTYRRNNADETWTAMAEVPVHIRESSCTYLNGNIWCFGGNAEGLSWTWDIFVYTVANDSWAKRPETLPYERASLTNGCPYLDRYIYIFGGKANKTGLADESVLRYDTLTATVTNMTNLTYPFRDGVVACKGDGAYLTTGYDDITGNHNITALYNMTTQTETRLATYPIKVRETAGDIIRGTNKLVVCGGYTTTTIKSCYQYDISGDSWSSIDDLPAIRRLHSATANTTSVIFAGGYSTTPEEEVFVYTIESQPNYVIQANNTAVNISAVTTDPNGLIYIDSNLTDFSISSGTTPYENTSVTITETEGNIYNITAWYEETTNYARSSKSVFVKIVEGAPVGDYITATFNYSTISFGSLSSGDINISVPNQVNGTLNVTIDTNANYKVTASGTNFTDGGTHTFSIDNLLMDTNSSKSNILLTDSLALGESSKTIDTGILSTQTESFHGFWINIPSNQYATSYSSTVTITYSNV